MLSGWLHQHHILYNSQVLLLRTTRDLWAKHCISPCNIPSGPRPAFKCVRAPGRFPVAGYIAGDDPLSRRCNGSAGLPIRGSVVLT